MVCIRGAVSAEQNSKENILENTKTVLERIISVNNLKISDIISIIFTCTRDLDAVYPAAAARELGITQAALMCFDEMYVKNSMEKCIRVMVTADLSTPQSEARHIYLKEAAKLRPDLTGQA